MGGGKSYRLYGLTVQSPFPLPCPRSRSQPDVRLTLAEAAVFAPARDRLSRRQRRDWFCSRVLDDGRVYIRWSELFEFLISADGRQITCRPLKHANPESFTSYLIGQVLSFSLLAFGREPLHGSAIVINRGAVALVGNCGYGKSTLAGALLGDGFRVVSDDVLALERGKTGWILHPGIPRIKLFPSIARRLLGPHVAGTRMNPGTSKLILPLKSARTAGRPVRLRAIYVLSDPGSSSKASKSVRIEALTGGEAFLAVIRASFNLIDVRRARLQNQFANAGRVTADVPVRRLTYARSVSMLGKVCDALLADVKTLDDYAEHSPS